MVRAEWSCVCVGGGAVKFFSLFRSRCATDTPMPDWSKLFILAWLVTASNWFFLVAPLILLLLVCASVYMCVDAHAMACMWKPENNFGESAFSLHLDLGSLGPLRRWGLFINRLTWCAISPALWRLSLWNSQQTAVWCCVNSFSRSDRSLG